MSVAVLEEPVIICVAGWHDDDRDSVLVLGWSEIDNGPIPTRFAHDAPICSRMQSEDGLLIGGLYATDYERGQTDFRTCKPAPHVTTQSYELGLQKAAEEEYDRLAILVQMVSLTGCPMKSQDEYESMEETLHLMSSVRNAVRLNEAIAEIDAGNVVEIDWDDEDGEHQPV